MGKFYSSIDKQEEKRHHPSFQKIRMNLKKRQQLVETALLLIVGLLASANAAAYDFEKDGIYYNITSEDDKTVEVTHNGDSSYSWKDEIVIPSSVISRC